MNKLLVGFAMCCAVLVSCTVQPESSVSVNFGDEVDRHQHMMFTFAYSARPEGVGIGVADTSRYADVSPAVPGVWRWISDSELVFHAGAGFAPATQYQLTLRQSAFRTDSAHEHAMPSGSWRFHTPWQQIESARATWVLSAVTRHPEVRVDIALLYDVNPDHAMQHCRVNVNGQILGNIALVQENTNEANESEFSIRIPASMLPDAFTGAITVSFEKGLRPTQGGSETTEVLQTSVSIPDRSVLELTSVSTSWLGMQGVLSLFTSQSLDPFTLAGGIDIEPSVRYLVERTETGCRISGDFVAATSYTLIVRTSLRGDVGGAVPAEIRYPFVFGAMEPSIAFTQAKAMYLGSKGSKLVGVSIVNVPRVRVSVFRVYENNVIHLLHATRRWSWDEEDEAPVRGPNYDLSWVELDRYADTVYSREYDVASLGVSANGLATLNLDIRQHAHHMGMYIVRCEGLGDEYLSASKFVAISDVGLIVKQGTNDVVLMTHSLATAQPLGGVHLSLYSTNNQVIESATTGADGMVRIENTSSRFGRFTLGMVTAVYEGDLTFVLLNDTRVDRSRFETDGLNANAAGLHAYMYGDRDVYRPGEVMRLVALVRNEAMKVPADAPLTLRIRQPNGAIHRSLRLQATNDGAAECSVAIPAAAMTGLWAVEALSAGGVQIGSYDVAVEDFMPDKLRVDVSLSSSSAQPGATVGATIRAATFYGTPAAARPTETTVIIRPVEFASKRYPAFTFSCKLNRDDAMRQLTMSGTLDAAGQYATSFTIDSALKNHGMLRAMVAVSVTDETGRPIHRMSTLDVHTQRAYFGVGPVHHYASPRKPLSVRVMACAPNGSPVDAQARVQLVRREYHTVLERTWNDRYRYVSQRKDVVVSDRVERVSGTESAVTVTPTVSGEYEVRVSNADGGAYVVRSFYAFGWGATEANSFAVNTEGLVDIAFDKESYKPGDRATVLFTTPFAGKLLVSVERNSVLEHHVVQTDKRSASLQLTVREDWAPNVYIGVTLIKPHTTTDVPFTVAHGYAPLIVERSNSRLPLSINAVQSSRSHRKQKVSVTTTPGAYVTIAAVDEGILQLRSAATPNPWAFFHRKRALGVESYNMYAYLLPELAILRSASGAGDERALRLNPFTSRRVEPVSLWSGIIHAKSGTATVEFDIPTYAGELRIMAVAWKGTAMASQQQALRVADPIVVHAALPRVLAPTDSIDVPILIHNTTGKGASATVEIAVSGPLRVANVSQRSVSLAPGAEARVMATVVAAQALGLAKVTATVTANGESFVHTTEIAVRSAMPLVVTSQNGRITEGASATVQVAANTTSSGSTAQLLVTRFPSSAIVEHLDQLLVYPHGCAEQTISMAFPQLYVADLAAVWRKNVLPTYSVREAIQDAVRKVESMQGPGGGIHTWPGGSKVDWWTSIYATHFLFEARSAGYDVHGQVLQRLTDYVARRARMREVEQTWSSSGQQQSLQQAQPARETFYSLFVLAAMGKQDVSTMNSYKARSKELSDDSRYLLACAYRLMGDERSFESLLSNDALQSQRGGGRSFATPIRDVALALYALARSAPNDGRCVSLAKRLGSMMKSQPSHSTQERAFAVMALGVLARESGSTPCKVTVTQSGKTLATVTTEAVAMPVTSKDPVQLKCESGTAYYTVITKGIPLSTLKVLGDFGMAVRRTYRTRDGKAVDLLNVKQSDVMVVAISIRTTDRSEVDNVAISDVLPSGFEIENPRLGAAAGITWAKDAATPEHYDYRDDRMNIYVKATATERTYYYIVRAVTRGSFDHAPIAADAMYDGNTRSYAGGGRIRVR